jgi:hypothetical protein
MEMTSRNLRAAEGIWSARHQPGDRISFADNVIAMSHDAGTKACIE